MGDIDEEADEDDSAPDKKVSCWGRLCARRKFEENDDEDDDGDSGDATKKVAPARKKGKRAKDEEKHEDDSDTEHQVSCWERLCPLICARKKGEKDEDEDEDEDGDGADSKRKDE